MTRLVAVLALAATVIAAGCGGSSGGGALSKSEFIKQADAICANTDKQAVVLTIPQPLQTATKEQLTQLGVAGAKDVKVERVEIDQLRKLKPPGDFRDAYDKVLTDLSTSMDDLDKAAAAAAKGDIAAVDSSLRPTTPLFRSVNLVATGYGLKVCGANR